MSVSLTLSAASLLARPSGGAPITTFGPDMQRLHRRYPPRVVPSTWSGTCQDRDQLLARLLAPPFTEAAMRAR